MGAKCRCAVGKKKEKAVVAPLFSLGDGGGFLLFGRASSPSSCSCFALGFVFTELGLVGFNGLFGGLGEGAMGTPCFV